jgi:predicted flap endonuclease-1-like 5' DNA nuclease
MLTWMQDYWYLCLIALVIGIATGWWIWARAAADAGAGTAVAEPAAPLQPVKPDIVAAEPVRFAAPPPAPEPEAAAVAAATGGPKIAAAVGAADNLMLLKGVGPKLNTLLASLGVIRFDQIAAWTADEIAEVDGYLGSFKGRITRDNWVDQAGYLARGDKAGFEAKYGALGSEL